MFFLSEFILYHKLPVISLATLTRDFIRKKFLWQRAKITLTHSPWHPSIIVSPMRTLVFLSSLVNIGGGEVLVTLEKTKTKKRE